MLASSDLIAFVATLDPERARAFYGDVLGLSLESDDGFALVFDANGIMLRVVRVAELTPVERTSVGWRVDDIESSVRQLVERGVRFERYAGLPQDDLAIWTTPDGSKVAWFKDPDANVLSLTQFRAPRG
jgi:catechol 2,3-dioxygenase-like lactoylglutathione lyase family enzyme